MLIPKMDWRSKEAETDSLWTRAEAPARSEAMMVRQEDRVNRADTIPWDGLIESFWDHWRYGLDYLKTDLSPPTGLTPKYTVWRKHNSRLYRYYSETGPVYPTPVVLIYALINKPYIVDMIPGFSMIESLVDEGFDVYLLDWGDFGPEEASLSIGQLVEGRMRQAVQAAAREAGSESVSLLGVSMGGTLAAIYAALFSEPRVKNLINIGGQIDFSDGGIASRLMKRERFDPVQLIQAFPLVPRDLVSIGATLLNPVKHLVGGYTRFWRLFGTGMPVVGYHALNKWFRDGVNFPGTVFAQWVIDFYQKNKIVRGEMTLFGERIDLGRIESSILALSGGRDHIVPGHQVRALVDLAGGGDKTYKEYPVDHDGLLFGRLAKRDIYPHLADWLRERSD
ncbi:MAG: alpha/beta fold hydrolase [Solirubrobacterales bacterium]